MNSPGFFYLLQTWLIKYLKLTHAERAKILDILAFFSMAGYKACSGAKLSPLHELKTWNWHITYYFAFSDTIC